MNENETVLTVSEVASELKVARKTVYRLLARGVIRALPHLRVKRIPRTEVDRLLSSVSSGHGPYSVVTNHKELV
jgi:excisionase family DNA binding protein